MARGLRKPATCGALWTPELQWTHTRSCPLCSTRCSRSRILEWSKWSKCDRQHHCNVFKMSEVSVWQIQTTSRVSACYFSDKDPLHLLALVARIEEDDLGTDLLRLLSALRMVPEKNKTDEELPGDMLNKKNMKHPGAVWLLWCLAADDQGLLHLRQLTVCEVAAHPDASAALDQRHVVPHAYLCARKNATWIETVKWKKCTWHWTMSAKIRLVILRLPTSDMALVHDVAHANLRRRMSKLHPTKLTS